MSQNEQPESISVTRLTEMIKGTLESSFSTVWVEGEISDIAKPRSGQRKFWEITDATIDPDLLARFYDSVHQANIPATPKRPSIQLGKVPLKTSSAPPVIKTLFPTPSHFNRKSPPRR